MDDVTLISCHFLSVIITDHIILTLTGYRNYYIM